MKRSNKLVVLLCSLIAAHASAKVVFTGIGSSGNRSSNSSTASTVQVGSSSTSTSVNCRRDTAVSYGFMNTILLGDSPSYTIADGKVAVDLPSYVSACISDLSAEAISNPVDNNIYLKFNVIIDSSAYTAGTGTIEEEYEKCLEELSGGDKSFYSLDKLKAAGHVSPPARIVINTPAIDQNKNSELVIASTNKDFVYGSDLPFGPSNVAKSTTFSDERFNCMNFAKPADSKIMVNKTNEYVLREEAIAVCNGKNLSDIATTLRKLRSESGGNYNDLTRILSGIQYSLIEEESERITKRLEEIEGAISPSTEDVKEGDKYGVSKDKRRKLLKEYAAEMNKFSKDLLPSLKEELSFLMTEYDELGDSDEDELRKEQIIDQTQKINDLIATFNRQQVNGAEYKKVVSALREQNMQSSGRKILSAIILAQEYGYVKPIGTGNRSVEKAEYNSKKKIRRLELGTLADWGDEALLRAGDRSPLERRKKVIAGIKSKAAKERKAYAAKQEHYAEYMQNYANDLVSSYCGFGSNQQDCMAVKTQYVPYIAQQFQNWQNNSAMQFKTDYSNKYGSAINEQNQVYNRFSGIYNNFRLNQMQSSFDNSGFDSQFDLWTGIDNDFSSTGIPGFNLGNLGSNDFNLFGPTTNTTRSPGSNMWSNPYQ